MIRKVRRRFVREWQWIAYHLGGGMSFDDYMGLTLYERWAHHEELAELLERAGPKPKDMF